MNGYLAYVRVSGHDRTGNPAPRTRKEGQLYNPQRHYVRRDCALPPYKDAQRAQARPRAQLTIRE